MFFFRFMRKMQKNIQTFKVEFITSCIQITQADLNYTYSDVNK